MKKRSEIIDGIPDTGNDSDRDKFEEYLYTVIDDFESLLNDCQAELSDIQIGSLDCVESVRDELKEAAEALY